MATRVVRTMWVLCLCVCMLFSLTGVVRAAGTRDIDGHWAEETIGNWVKRDLIKGYPGGDIKPDNPMTRAEYFSLLNRSFGFNKTKEHEFSDVTPDDWFAEEIRKASYQGYLQGFAEDVLSPKRHVTREEVVAILGNILKWNVELDAEEGFSDADESASWARGHINVAKRLGYIKGYPDNTFGPGRTASRAEVIAILDRIVGEVFRTVGVYGSEEIPGHIEGNATVTAADITLRNLVIDGHLYLTEGIGDGSVTLDGVTVRGTTTISGGEGGIIIKHSYLGDVIVHNPHGEAINLTTEGASSVGPVEIRSKANLKESPSNGVSGGGFQSVLLNGPEGLEVALSGDVDKVEIASSSAKVSLCQAKVGELIIDGVDTVVSAENTVAIENLVINRPAKVTGICAVRNVKITSDNVIIETMMTGRIDVLDGLTGIMIGGRPYPPPPPVVVYDPVTIVSVASIPDITKPFGTAKDDLGLPNTVSITLSNGGTREVAVNHWDDGEPIFTGDAGTYVFSGDLAVPSGVTNPSGIKAQVKVVIEEETQPIDFIQNIDPNPNTWLRTSPGETIYEFDGLDEMQPSASAVCALDERNVMSGSASITLSPSAPIVLPEPTDPNLPQIEFFSVKTAGSLGDKLKNLEVMEFNIYKPEVRDRLYDYMLVNFYTDDSYNYFFQTAIGNWELSSGWNTIRRTKADFEFIDSLAGSSTEGSAVMMGAQKSMDHRAILRSQVDQLNRFLRDERASESRLDAMGTVTPSWDNITCMEFFASSKVGTSLSINLDRLSLNPTGRAVVLFTFDDAWKDVLENGKPILDAKGFKATTWANKASSTDPYPSPDPREAFLNEEELNQLYAAGWDIGNHSVNHIDDISGLTDEQLLQEYLENQEWLLVENGWERGAYHVCYPSGQYSERLIEILREIGVLTGRTTEYGIQPTPVPNIYKLKTVFISRNDPDGDDHLNNYVIPEIHRAVQTGSSLFFMLHRVADDPTDDWMGELAVSPADLQTVVDIVDAYVQAGQLQVMTISQWYAAYMRPADQP
jgi:peptidoglycan/xylan/chitin deacetylase (PgdA/CDA1 family)